MTFEERMDALATNLELTAQQAHENSDRIRQNSEHIDRLFEVLARLLPAIDQMADAVNSHERRLTRLEDRPA